VEEFNQKKGMYDDFQYTFNSQQYLRIADFLIFHNGKYVHAKTVIENKRNILFVDNSNGPLHKDVVLKCLILLASHHGDPGYQEPRIDTDHLRHIIENFDSYNGIINYKNIKIQLCDEALSSTHSFNLNGIDIAELNLIKQNISRNLELKIRKDVIVPSHFSYTTPMCVTETKTGDKVLEGICMTSKDSGDYILLHIGDNESNQLKSTQCPKMYIVEPKNALWWAYLIMLDTNKKSDKPFVVSGLIPTDQTLPFCFVFPIYNLRIPKDFSFGGVSYNIASGLDAKSEKIFVQMLNNQKPSETIGKEYDQLQTPHAYAKVWVETNIVNAYKTALSTFNKSFNLFLLFLRDDSLKLHFNSSDTFSEWDDTIVKTNPKTGNCFYIEECKNKMKAVVSTEIDIFELYSIDKKRIEIIDQGNILENFFYASQSDTKNLLKVLYFG